MDIPYCAETKILGYNISNTVHASTSKSWKSLTARIRAQVQDAYYRDLSLDNRTKYSFDYLLAKVWYIAQMFLPPDDSVRQLNTTISWHIWKWEMFRVPLFTLQWTKEEGGWELINLTAKCLELFLYRMRAQGMRTGTIAAD
jgi:hypothetical protein